MAEESKEPAVVVPDYDDDYRDKDLSGAYWARQIDARLTNVGASDASNQAMEASTSPLSPPHDTEKGKDDQTRDTRRAYSDIQRFPEYYIAYARHKNLTSANRAAELVQHFNERVRSLYDAINNCVYKKWTHALVDGVWIRTGKTIDDLQQHIGLDVYVAVIADLFIEKILIDDGGEHKTLRDNRDSQWRMGAHMLTKVINDKLEANMDSVKSTVSRMINSKQRADLKWLYSLLDVDSRIDEHQAIRILCRFLIGSNHWVMAQGKLNKAIPFAKLEVVRAVYGESETRDDVAHWTDFFKKRKISRQNVVLMGQKILEERGVDDDGDSLLHYDEWCKEGVQDPDKEAIKRIIALVNFYESVKQSIGQTYKHLYVDIEEYGFHDDGRVAPWVRSLQWERTEQITDAVMKQVEDGIKAAKAARAKPRASTSAGTTSTTTSTSAETKETKRKFDDYCMEQRNAANVPEDRLRQAELLAQQSDYDSVWFISSPCDSDDTDFRQLQHMIDVYMYFRNVRAADNYRDQIREILRRFVSFPDVDQEDASDGDVSEMLKNAEIQMKAETQKKADTQKKAEANKFVSAACIARAVRDQPEFAVAIMEASVFRPSKTAVGDYKLQKDTVVGIVDYAETLQQYDASDGEHHGTNDFRVPNYDFFRLFTLYYMSAVLQLDFSAAWELARVVCVDLSPHFQALYEAYKQFRISCLNGIAADVLHHASNPLLQLLMSQEQYQDEGEEESKQQHDTEVREVLNWGPEDLQRQRDRDNEELDQVMAQSENNTTTTTTRPVSMPDAIQSGSSEDAETGTEDSNSRQPEPARRQNHRPVHIRQLDHSSDVPITPVLGKRDASGDIEPEGTQTSKKTKLASPGLDIGAVLDEFLEPSNEVTEESQSQSQSQQRPKPVPMPSSLPPQVRMRCCRCGVPM